MRFQLSSLSALGLLSLYVHPSFARVTPPSNPYPAGSIPDPSNPLEIDLGYGGYAGVYDPSQGLNHWYGIKYAQAPIGDLRWQPSIPPQSTFNGTFVNATTIAAECPQAPDHEVSTEPAWTPSSSESEDCLIMNIFSPPGAVDLPVFIYIHGGGYGEGSGSTNVPFLMSRVQSEFVGVTIQYRLGAFGFLAGNEVQKYGTANAGLHDQYLSLQWIQKYISLFGGDPNRVTISGESAGGGSVMLQSMAYGGAVGDELFNNIFAASPYLPQQYNYDDPVPVATFEAFAAEAGCSSSSTETVFECLVNSDTDTLQNASYIVTVDAKYGQWAFLPVTDGSFVEQRPSVQLTTGPINGKRGLIGNNANEGVAFTPQNVTTEDDFVNFVKYLMPELTDKDVQEILAQYPLPEDLPTVRFATDGLNKDVTAVSMSTFGVGQQQRANNLYAEMTFVCPAYWLAEAFSLKGGQSYKYQFSLINSLHGDDLEAYFDALGAEDTMSQRFGDAFVSFLDSFIISGTPTNSSSYLTNLTSEMTHFLSSWPTYNTETALQVNLNQTGGNLTTAYDIADPYDIEIMTYIEPGLEPDFSVVNAYDWEGGRGERCDFWKSIGAVVPEKE